MEGCKWLMRYGSGLTLGRACMVSNRGEDWRRLHNYLQQQSRFSCASHIHHRAERSIQKFKIVPGSLSVTSYVEAVLRGTLRVADRPQAIDRKMQKKLFLESVNVSEQSRLGSLICRRRGWMQLSVSVSVRASVAGGRLHIQHAVLCCTVRSVGTYIPYLLCYFVLRPSSVVHR